MKKVTVIITAIALTLGMAQCRKHVETIAQPAGGTVDVTVRVENGSDKTDITATGVVTWKQGDKIYIVGETQGLLGYVSALSAGDPVNFAGSITAISSAQTLKFYYVGDKTFTLDGSGNYTFGISGQDGSLAGIAAYNQMMFGKTTGTVPAGTTDLGTINMNSVMAIAHLNINDGGSAVSGPVTVTGGFASATFNAKTYTGGTLTGTAGDMTMTFATGTTSTNCYIALLPGAQTLTFMDAGGKMARFSEKTIAVNGFYNAGTAIEVTVKPVEFTVNKDNGTTVTFSPGNLYYDGSESKWKFESNQWDFRTYNDGTKKGGSCIGGVYDANSGTPSGDWGLFGWSTGSTTYGMSISEDPADYSGVFKDWGGITDLPDNAGGKTWRTLRNDEWENLLGISGGSSPRDNAASLCAWVTLDNGVKGLVILPDGSTVTASSVTTTALVVSSGAVFLPAAGYRSGTDVSSVGSDGYYWSSSLHGSTCAYSMGFDSGDVYSDKEDDRDNGNAVRLVR